MINDLRYESQEMFLNSGIRNTYYAGFKNVNTGGKNSTTYKDDFNSQGLSEYIFRTSYPLIRNGLNFDNYLTPKISLQYSPHNMINLSGNSRRIDAKGVWSVNRIGQSDSVESGQSLTIGMDFKRSRKIQGMLVKDTIKEVESDEPLDVLELNLAGVFRDEINEDMPITSSLNQTSSDLLGKVLINPAKYLKFEYDFNLDNNFDVFKYNGISTTLDVNNFLTTFKYAEENDPIGKAHYWENITEYQFNDTSSIQFATRRNKKINLTEFYDLIYQYKNDCLTAAVKYRRDYYDDRDIKPTQDLFFSLTIVPLGAYQTKNLFNNNEKNN
jgi:LPS-assembly protein